MSDSRVPLKLSVAFNTRRSEPLTNISLIFGAVLLGELLFLAPPAYASSLPPGCTNGSLVKQDGTAEFTSIQAAVDAIPSGLTSDACIVILDTGTYAEQVTVRGFDNNGHRITIMADPSLANSPPVITPPTNSSGAFVVQNASVSILGFNIIAANSIWYGINASSDSVMISSVNILDPLGRVANGIALTNWSSISYSSITAKNGTGILISGTGNEVTYSTATTSHINYRPLHLYGADSNRITHSNFFNSVGIAVENQGSNNSFAHCIIRGSMNGLLSNYGSTSSNTVTQCDISADYASAVLLSGSYNTITESTMSYVQMGGSYNIIRQSFIHSNANRWGQNSLSGISFYGHNNLITQSTVTATDEGVVMSGSSNTLEASYVEGTNAVKVTGIGHVIESNVLVGLLSGGNGVITWTLDGIMAERLSIASNVIIAGPQGAGITVFLGNQGSNTFSSNTVMGGRHGVQIDSRTPGAVLTMSSITFSGLAPGATAIRFLGGTFVSDFPSIAFADPGISINVDASALSGDSCLNMISPSGTRSGPSFENDPFGYVNWGPSVCTTLPQGFTNISSVSLSVNWSSTFGSTKTFYSVISTGAFPNLFAGNLSSATANTFASFSGLTPNTLYHGAASTTPAGPYTQLGSTATLAATPAQTALIAVASRTASLDWSQNANPEPGTAYELWRDLSSDFTIPTVTVVSTSAAELSGLIPNTTYYWKVRAINLDGIPSDFDQTVSARTFPPTPSAPSLPSGSALGVSSISWTWTAVPDAQTYRLVRSTDGALLTSTSGLSFVQTGLSPNRPYGAAVLGVNASGEGPLSPATTVWTLARPPSGTVVNGVYVTSAAISWSLNDNPATTVAEVQRSSDGTVFTPVYSSATTSLLDGALLSCTTYYFRVRNENTLRLPTDFDTTVILRTSVEAPAPANSLSAVPVADNRVALTWVPSVSAGVTEYRLYFDGGFGAVDYDAPIAVFASTETSWTSGPLVSSAAYTFALRARHRCGVEETGGVFAIAGSTRSLDAVRAVIKTPDSGKRIKGNSLTIMAELASGTPGQVREIRFQYRLSGTQDWSDVPARGVNHPNPDPDSPYFIQTDVDAWGAGSYDLRAVAVDLTGQADGAPAAVTVVVVPTDPDIEEREIGGKVTKQQTVNDAIINTIVAAGASADDPAISIRMPAGALGGSTVAVTVMSNPQISTGPPAGTRFAGSAVQIDLSNGGHFLSGGLTASVTLSYPPTVADPSRLRIESLDEATGGWSPLSALSIDIEKRTITAATPHFSIFAVIMTGAASASDLDGVRVYPVPYKPNGSNPDEGRPYFSGDANSGIVFDNLPAGASIKIYTFSGRLVARSDGSAGGRIQWDARNTDGRSVASGAYFAVVSAPGSKSVVKNLVIIR